MKHYGADIEGTITGNLSVQEGQSIENLTAPSGTSFPANVTVGELFYRTDLDTLYVCTNVGSPVEWTATGTSITGILTTSYISSNQTITTAGSLTLSHGLGNKPALIQCYIKCITADANYSVGDEVLATSQESLAVIPDSTNLNVRFGSATNVFSLPDKSSGTLTGLTNSYWNLIVKAWV